MSGQDKQCSPPGQSHKIQTQTLRYTHLKFRAGGGQCQGRTNNAPQHQDSIIRFSHRHSGTRFLSSGLGGHQCQGRTDNAPQHQDSIIRFSHRHSGTRFSSSGLGGHQCQGRTDNAPQHQDSLIRFSLRHSGRGHSSSGTGEISVRAGQKMLLNTRTVS